MKQEDITFKKCINIPGTNICQTHSDFPALPYVHMFELCKVRYCEEMLKAKKSGWDDCENFHKGEIRNLRLLIRLAHRALLQLDSSREFQDVLDEMWDVITPWYEKIHLPRKCE